MDLVEQIREDLKASEEAEARNRQDALDDLKFAVAGEQWPEQQKANRTRDGRPCLVTNRINAVIKQITNQQRQQKPAITISPVADGADEETAQILQGLIRHIEYNSNAETAYDQAMEFAVTTGGPGWIRVLTDYCDPQSFDQEILIKPVKNAFSVYADPTCQESDYSDARYMVVVEDLTRSEYKKLYPKSELADILSLGTVGDTPPDWVKPDGVRIAEYWYIETEDKMLVQLADGTKAYQDELPAGAKVAQDRNGKPIMRHAEVKHVKWVKTNGVEILEQGDWAGDYIPLVPVLGDEAIIDGKRYLMGVVRFAKDPCRQYNFMTSAQTEAIALAPRAPYIGTRKQFEGVAEQWKTANTRNHAFLTYNPH